MRNHIPQKALVYFRGRIKETDSKEEKQYIKSQNLILIGMISSLTMKQSNTRKHELGFPSSDFYS